MNVVNHEHTNREVVYQEPDFYLFTLCKPAIRRHELCLTHKSIACIDHQKVSNNDAGPLEYDNPQ